MTGSLASMWFSAAELAESGLPGIPNSKRGVNARAAAEGWAKKKANDGTPLVRPRQGPGGGVEYHVFALPFEAQDTLYRSEKAAFAPAPRQDSHDPHVLARWEEYDAQSSDVKRRAEERAAILAEVDAYVAGGSTRSGAIGIVGHRHGYSRSAIASWRAAVKGLNPSDRLPFLAPQYKGGGKRAEPDLDLWQAITSDYLRPEKPSWSTCYRRTLKIATAKGIDLPSEKTLWRRFKKEVPREVVKLKRYGPDALRQTLPPQKRSVADLHAMEVVNIDGHRCNVRVELPDGKVIRPTMVAIQDVYSRKFLAWRFAPTEDTITARLVFADLFAKYGIPKGLLADNGRAFASKWLTGGMPNRFRFKVKDEEPVGLLTILGVQVHWALPFRGSSKPIERAFRDFCDEIAKHPSFAGAYTGANALDKPDNYGEKTVDWETFERVFNEGVHDHNARAGRKTETAHGQLSFNQVFDASYAAAPIGKASPETLRMALYAAEQVRADRKSGAIKLLGNVYWSHDLGKMAGQALTVRFDPENAHSPVYVYDQRGRFIATADLWEADGFLDAAAAKRRAKLEGDHRKAARAAADALDLLKADQLAELYPTASPDDEQPSPKIVRPVRARGVTAAALKVQPDDQPEAEHEPKKTDFIDAFTAGTSRLRIVE